jgi:sphingomyelin phosphodiesterase acid-like 3
LALALAFSAAAEVEPAAMLVVSDIHFDPMADPALVDRLAAAPPEEWRAILESKGAMRLGRYGRDSTWGLVRAALAQMKETLPHPAMVVIPGDFLTHGFRKAFNAAARDHSARAHRDFVRKTMRFLALQLVETFPDTPILPALGNNDDDCGDYQVEPNGGFLADTLPLLRRLVGSLGAPGFDAEWPHYGNFAVSAGRIRIVFPNTVLFSKHYRNACGTKPEPDPGQATLRWLGAELAAAKEAGRPVWLVYHIPPGIDGYATWYKGACPDRIVPMWRPADAEGFAKLLRQYGDTVKANIAGHTHMDDFRLMGDAAGNYGFALITPALSPIFGQNPAFRTMTYDEGGGLLDQTTYNLTNLFETAIGLKPRWQAEYTFTREWSLPRIDLPSLAQLYAAIGQNADIRERWHAVYPVSSPVFWALSAGGAQAVRAFDCATGHLTPAAYARCFCAGQSD